VDAHRTTAKLVTLECIDAYQLGFLIIVKKIKSITGDVTFLRKMRIWSIALVSLEMYPCNVFEYENPAPTGESRKMILHTWIGQTRLN